MGRQAVVDPALHQDLHQLHVVPVHLGLLLECDLGRLFVCPFAQANANALGQKLVDVGLRRAHVGLDYRTYASRVRRHPV